MLSTHGSIRLIAADGRNARGAFFGARRRAKE